MAEKILKGIVFPGLEDTYIIPEVDDTLSKSGASADAKIVGEALSGKQPVGNYVKSVNGNTPDENGNITIEAGGDSDSSGSSLPEVTEDDNGKVMTVVNGAWAAQTPSVGGLTEVSWNDLTDRPFYEKGNNVEILPETTFDGFALNGDFGYTLEISPTPFILELGKTYRVVWDEKEWTCEAQDVSALIGFEDEAVAIGNVSDVFGIGTGNGEDFAICYRDGSAALITITDDSQSHTVSICENGTIKTLDKKFLPIPYFGEENNQTDIFPLTRCENFTFDTSFNLYTYGIDANCTLTVGENYKCLWDGVEYTCEALDVSSMYNGLPIVAFGNGAAFGFSGNNEPFIVVCNNGNGYLTFACLTHTEPCEYHDVRIYQENTVVTKIDPKYLPDNIGGGSGTGSSLPEVTTDDAGKFLRVSSSGTWAVESIPNAEEASF